MRLVLFLAFTSVAAYDDQSLMQQNLGVESRLSATEFKRAVDNVQQAMQNIPYTGKMRALAFDSLMQELAAQPSLTPGAQSVLDEVITLLNSIIAQFKDERTANQKALDALTTSVNWCNTRGQSSVDNNEEAFDNDTTEANDCRVNEQKVAFEAASSACYTVLRVGHAAKGSNAVSEGFKCTHWQEGTSGDFADNKDHYDHLYGSNEAQNIAAFARHADFIGVVDAYFSDDTLIGAWAKSFDTNDDWVKKSIDDLTSPDLITECESRTATLEQKIQTCDAAQSKAKTAFCVWKRSVERMCNGTDTHESRADCYNNVTNWHTNDTNGVQKRIEAIATERTKQGKLVVYIKCLVEKLKEENTDIASCDPSAAEVTQMETDFDNIYPQPDPMTECSMDDINFEPGSADMHAKFTNDPQAPRYDFTGTDDCPAAPK